jgi:hypothetical protein
MKKLVEIISMRMGTSKLTQVLVSATILSAAFALPAIAAAPYGDSHSRSTHRIHRRTAARPLTITKRYSREPVFVAAPDPFHGPAAIITAPVAVAGMIVSLPFRAIGAVFPPQGNPATNPLVLVGAPVHLAGQIAQSPFYAINSAFGVAPGYY